jgi:CHAT domain-containing protein
VIVAHAELHYLPFAALLNRAAGDRYLVESFEISTVPSASVWVRLRQRTTRRPRPHGLLALAPRVSALPGTGAEVTAIRRLFPESSLVLVGRAASKAALLAAAHDRAIVHLASSAVLNQQNPLFSFLQLAPTGEDDGRLEVHEVFGLPLAARLLVLSACETGLGSGTFADVPPGDDWVGLTRAFLLAGADNVVATLWLVDDQRTARLMTRFYRHLAESDRESLALAAAQRELLADRRTAAPYFWAGFALVGAAGDGSASP